MLPSTRVQEPAKKELAGMGESMAVLMEFKCRFHLFPSGLDGPGMEDV